MSYALFDDLQQFFQQHTASKYWIALSGGLDSQVLLHVCARLQALHGGLSFAAIHIDHGLHADSPQWAQQCQQLCTQLQIPLSCETVQVSPQGSLEAQAREARYHTFQRYLNAGEMLLTAHHQNDQAETFLLHLLRGSGVQGLAAMPLVRRLGEAHLGRPLLPYSRQDLQAYAQQHALQAIDDPSNEDTRFDRNFLRHKVLPLLQQRWPAVHSTIARAASWQSESLQVLASLLDEKLLHLAGSRQGTLSVQALLAEAPAMQKALLRHWLQQTGFRLPSAKKLQHVLHDVLTARPDALPCVQWQGCDIRRYRDDLYALAPPITAPPQAMEWQDTQQALDIKGCANRLEPSCLHAWLPQLPAQACRVWVRFRQGGEQVHLAQRGGHHSLKKLLQEAGIPPWERERLPLVYVGEQLVFIPGVLQLQPQDRQ